MRYINILHFVFKLFYLMAESFELLCLTLDANSLWWGRLLEEHNDDKGILLHSFIHCVVSFCHAFKYLNSLNQLLVIAAGSNEKKVLYCDSTNSSDTLKQCIENGLHDFVQQSSEQSTRETKIAGALASSLCYSNRIKKDSLPNQVITSRMIVLKLSDDVCSQYMNLMNIFFTAQKQNILIDCCVLYKDSALMQQASDLTGGIYVKVNNIHALLQYLLGVFLPTVSERAKMQMPKSGDVDYRPACFCHQRLISTGWVCSVCLSVFCQFSPICATCQSVFKFLPTLPKMVKKRKAK